MSENRRPQRRSRVPTGRFERMVRIGWLTGEIALGGAAESLRRLGGGAASPGNPFLTGANGRRFASRLSTMRGAAMKLGQLLSLEGDDWLPPEVAEALAVLRAEGDAMPKTQLRRVLGRNWGKGWQERFSEFDFEPIAAASIGQVHAARTRDGRDLALKIQYPGVASSIDSDVDNLAALLRLVRVLPGDVDFSQVIAEAKHQLRREADYHTEAEQLRRYRRLLADDPEVVVPRVHDDLTTSRILAMDRLRGVPLEDLCSPERSDAQRDQICTLLMRLVLREMFEFGFMQSDPNFANYLLLEDGRVALLDLGAGYEIPSALSSGYARLFRAAADADRAEVENVSREIGFVTDADSRAQVEAIVDLMLLVTEPLQHRGVYDFARSNLVGRARDASTSLVFKQRVWRPPPAATLLLQRKLGGTFLLCVRLRGRVDLRALLEEALGRGARAGEQAAASPAVRELRAPSATREATKVC